MTEKNKGKKLLTWTLALSMTLALPPVGVFAEEGAGGEGSQQTNIVPATEQPDGSSNGSGTANNKGTEPVSTPENGGQKTETAPPSGTTSTPAPSGEEQKGENETLTPLPTPVSGGEAEEGKDNTTPSEGKDENKDESKGETTGEVVTYAATIDGKEGTYETLQAAIDAAENGETVVLAKDVTENININKSITLDLKGKTLTADEGERAIEITPTVDFPDELKTILRQSHSIENPYFPNIDFKSSPFLSEYEETYPDTFNLPVINVKIKNGTITGGDLSSKQDGENNQAFIRCGGGIRISSCTVELTDCNIEGNKARYGGGIFCSNSTVTIKGGTISGNTAVDGHGNLYAAGGGISSFRSDLIINDVRITDNTANKGNTSYGGGLGVRGGSLIMTDTTISKNKAIQSGGGICIGPVNSSSKSIFPVEFTITGGSISENECTYNGGGIYYDSVQTAEQSLPCSISGTEITKNKSTHSGGGYSHAEGYNAVASGWYSHAGGINSKAKAEASFAHGMYAVSDYRGGAAFGVSNKTKDALFVVGNGSPGGSYESDALVLDNAGNLWVAGSIKCGGGSGGYTLSPATADTLGGVMIGDNISVTADGVISVNLSAYLKNTDIADWAKAESKPVYTAEEVGAAEKNHTHNVSDITDMPEWTKTENKPAYTASEVGAATAADITAAVNAIEIGGRNLLYDSTGNIKNGWSGNTIITVDGGISGNSLAISRTGYSGNARYFGTSKRHFLTDFEVGTSYTLSAWIKVRSDVELDASGYVMARFRSADNTKLHILPLTVNNKSKKDEWLYCEKTWTIDDSDIAKLECVALALDKNGMIEACNIKLEKGTKATDWSPAVEEDTERIASLEARVAALEAMAVSGGEV